MIAKSEVIVADCGKYITVTQHIYAECWCESLNHTARITCEKSVTIDGDESTEILFEFNGTEQLRSQRFSVENKFFWEIRFFIKKVVMAIRLIFGKDVYLSPDYMMPFEKFEGLLLAVRESKNKIINTRTKFDKAEEIKIINE